MYNNEFQKTEAQPLSCKQYTCKGIKTNPNFGLKYAFLKEEFF